MFKLPLVNPWVVLAVVAMVAGAGVYGYHRGVTNTTNSIEASIARENQIARVAYDNALRATASEIAKIEIVNKTYRQELEREVRIEPVYVDCRHTDDVKRLLDAILTGQAPAESLDRSKLSGTNAAD